MPKQARALDDKRFKQAIEKTKNDRERVMLLLSVKAGLRSVEIAGLTWGRIDFDGKTLLLSTTKGNKPRHVPMHGELVAALMAYRATRKGKDGKERSVLVNTRTHKPMTPNAVAVWLRDCYVKRLGWTGYSSHSGRRSFATNSLI